MEVVYVIGSGPSGVACALGLLARKNVQVVMLDVGKELEPGMLERRLANNSPIIYPYHVPPWEKNKKKEFFKHVFGSIYPYDIDDAEKNFHLTNAIFRASFAKGGLSNIWGASVMPYRQEDMHEWPITAEDMNPYYKKIFEFLPLSTCFQSDLLSWPLMHDNAQKYSLSPQAFYLWKRYLTYKSILNKRGILTGGSRLAIYQTNDYNQRGCIYCGECMYGCTKNAIYTSRDTLSILEKNPLFRYYHGVQVQRVSEDENTVYIEAREIKNQNKVSFSASKVFIAAGVMMSAFLLMQSFSWLKEVELEMLDSQYFILPCLMFHAIKNAHQKPTHSLCQLYYEIISPDIAAESIHLQLYTYISLYKYDIENKMGYFKKLSQYLHPLFNRLVMIQGYLPSSISGSLLLRFRMTDQQVIVKGKKNDNTSYLLKRLLFLLVQQSYRLGFLPVLPLFQEYQVGGSNHYGGSFPMKKNPSRINDSDCFGRPNGLKRIHLVDASVLPNILGQSITLTTMANAYRIGYECTL